MRRFLSTATCITALFLFFSCASSPSYYWSEKNGYIDCSYETSGSTVTEGKVILDSDATFLDVLRFWDHTTEAMRNATDKDIVISYHDSFAEDYLGVEMFDTDVSTTSKNTMYKLETMGRELYISAAISNLSIGGFKMINGDFKTPGYTSYSIPNSTPAPFIAADYITGASIPLTVQCVEEYNYKVLNDVDDPDAIEASYPHNISKTRYQITDRNNVVYAEIDWPARTYRIYSDTPDFLELEVRFLVGIFCAEIDFNHKLEDL